MELPSLPATCEVCGTAEGSVEASGRDYIYHGSQQIVTAWRCASCGHVYLNPRPTPEAIERMYPPHYASFSGKYTEGSALLARMKDRVVLGRVRSLVGDLPAGAHYLDVGCGDGQLLLAVKKHYPQVDVHGLDWKFDAATRTRLESAGIVLHETLLEQADLAAGFFDLVTMNQLIEHLWAPRDCLAMLKRALSARGRLAITTPNIDGYDRRLFKAGTWGGYYFPRHLNLFSRTSLVRLLEDNDLAVEQTSDLVAPVIWCYSLCAEMQTRFPSRTWLHRLCDIQNTPLMAALTMLDLVAMRLGARTSNQLAVARSRSTAPTRP